MEGPLTLSMPNFCASLIIARMWMRAVGELAVLMRAVIFCNVYVCLSVAIWFKQAMHAIELYILIGCHTLVHGATT